MEEDNRALIDIDLNTLNSLLADQHRLDYLQQLLDDGGYTGRCVLRDSGTGRGWRLHETGREASFDSVRDAIDHYTTSEASGKAI